MSKPTELTDEQITAALAELPGWEVDNGKLHKVFAFANFVEALGWMVSAGLEAEKMNHHPDWSNSWNKVDVHLMTHDIGALSSLDVELAKKMEALA